MYLAMHEYVLQIDECLFVILQIQECGRIVFSLQYMSNTCHLNSYNTRTRGVGLDTREMEEHQLDQLVVINDLPFKKPSTYFSIHFLSLKT